MILVTVKSVVLDLAAFCAIYDTYQSWIRRHYHSLDCSFRHEFCFFIIEISSDFPESKISEQRKPAVENWFFVLRVFPKGTVLWYTPLLHFQCDVFIFLWQSCSQLLADLYFASEELFLSLYLYYTVLIHTEYSRHTDIGIRIKTTTG